MSKTEEIVKKVALVFPSFGGGRKCHNNPIAAATLKKPPMFALGVDIQAVVEFVLSESGHKSIVAENEKMTEMLLAAGFIGQGTQIVGDKTYDDLKAKADCHDDLVRACRETLSTLTDEREVGYFCKEIAMLKAGLAKVRK